MSAIPNGKRIQAIFDGESFFPIEKIDLKPGSEVTLDVVEGGPGKTADEMWSALDALRGIAHAPKSFNWSFERDDLYRDAS